MSKLKPVKPEDFTLKKATINNDGLECSFVENRIIDKSPQVIAHKIKANYIPHPELIRLRDKLKEFLVKAYHMDRGYEHAINGLTGKKLKDAEDSYLDLLLKIEVTGVSIGGEEQLRGAVISGKVESNNGAKCAMNTPRIVFSSEKLGYEQDVEIEVGLIAAEVYRYIFEGKKAQAELFDAPEEKETKVRKLPAGELG